MLDTGVDAEHPDLKGKVANWAEFDAAGKRVTGSTPHDCDRHGTHVCGTIAGGNASGKWIGVAPDARLAVALGARRRRTAAATPRCWPGSTGPSTATST